MNKLSTKWHDELVKKVLSDPQGLEEYQAYKLQLALENKINKTRLKPNRNRAEL